MTALTRTRHSTMITAAACCLLILATLILPVSAAEGTIDCTYLEITGDGFVADTMNGVEARYNLYGPTLYCVELITRYYQEVYGLEIRCADGAPTVLNNSDLYFEKTSDPRPGDVMYGSAAARGQGYNHWALVKSNNGNSLTLFEQNWRWNGQAGVNRVIEYPTDYYEIYTLKSRSGAEIQPVTGSVAVVSSWAESYIDRAAEAGIADLGTDYQANVTRESFCRMALNVLSNYGIEPASAGSVCATAASLGLVTNPDGAQELSREEAAVITARLIRIIGQLPEADPDVLASYRDAGSISSWAAEAVAQVTACGLMSGSSGSFHPQGKLTNEQAVALMVRVDENPSPAVTYQSRPAFLSRRAAAVMPAAEYAAEGVVALSAGRMMLSRFAQYLAQ